MKKALAFVFFVITAAVLLDKGNSGGSMSEQTDSAGIARTKRIDSLLAANSLVIDQWSLYPTFSKTWVNGETKNESYIVAEFKNRDNSKPLDQAQLKTFSEQLYADIAADSATASSFQGLHVLFENTEDYLLFKSSTNYKVTFLFGESEQTVAAN